MFFNLHFPFFYYAALSRFMFFHSCFLLARFTHFKHFPFLTILKSRYLLITSWNIFIHKFFPKRFIGNMRLFILLLLFFLAFHVRIMRIFLRDFLNRLSVSSAFINTCNRETQNSDKFAFNFDSQIHTKNYLSEREEQQSFTCVLNDN